MTQGQTWMKQFQSQTQPQQSNSLPAPTPLSNKTGLNNQKKTALTQGVLQSLANPQGLMNQMNAQ